MTQDFTSVTLFYAALRDVLLTEVGMTVERTLSTYDLVLAGAGGFARVRKVTVSPTVAAVSLILGTDPDALSVSTVDPELCFPFNTSVPANFSGVLDWRSDLGYLRVRLAATDGSLRSYNAEFYFSERRVDAYHEDPPDNRHYPNFKVSGGPFLQVGV